MVHSTHHVSFCIAQRLYIYLNVEEELEKERKRKWQTQAKEALLLSATIAVAALLPVPEANPAGWSFICSRF